MAKSPGRVPPCVVLRSSWGEAARGFAQDVEAALRKRHMSMLALAEQCGISERAVLHLKRGFPADPQAAAAVARNLGLIPPNLETDPVYRLGLLLSQRRKRARLSIGRLAALSGLGIQTILRVERGQCWPRRGTCAALLAVPALELRPEDFTEFTRLALPAAPSYGLPLELSEHPTPPPAPAPRSPSRQLAFTVRVYTDGSTFFKPGRPLRT